MDVRRATTCCSAVALSLLISVSLNGQPAASSELRLFPVRQAWTIPLDSITTTTPAFAGGRAFIAVEGETIVAYDIQRGELEWSASGNPVSAPATGGGLLFLVEPTAITALRQDSGAVAWRLPFDEPLAVPLVWDNGWLIGATVPGTILAFRGSDGELIWRHELGARLHASPALAADRVYIPVEDHRVVALRVDTGETLWERRLGDAPNDMLALDERIYVGSDDNFLYCLEADDGEIAWRWRTGADVVGVPVADGQRVYFVSLDNVLRGLDLGSGAQRWKRSLPNRPTRGPVRVGDLLLVSGLSTKVSAFTMRDGSPAGDFAAPGEIAGGPYATEMLGLPQVVVVSRDIATGTRVSALRRNIEPDLTGRLATLPNPITVTLPPGAATAKPAADEAGTGQSAPVSSPQPPAARPSGGDEPQRPPERR